MYNQLVNFKGDIIITDPCYIVKEVDPSVYKKSPSWWDFVSRQKVKLVNGTEVHHEMPKPEDYPDCVITPASEYIEKYGSMALMELDAKAYFDYLVDPEKATIKTSETLKNEMEAYRKSEEAWRNSIEDDWDKCNFGEDMDALGFTTFLSDSTIYGDWGCTVKNLDNNKILGKFCADAGMVGVFLLDEVLAYNPEFKIGDHAATIIRDFDGQIEIACEGDDVYVKGTGNINFKSYQTSL